MFGTSNDILDYFYQPNLQIRDLVPGYTRKTIKDLATYAVDNGTSLKIEIENRKRDLVKSFNAAASKAKHIAVVLTNFSDDQPDPEFFLIYAVRAFKIAAQLHRRLTQDLLYLHNYNRPIRPNEVTQDDIANARHITTEQVLVDHNYLVIKTRSDCPLCDGKQSGKILASGRFYCHRCQVSHDSISLVQVLDEISFLAAVRQLVGK